MIEILILIISITYIWQHSGFIYDLSKLVYTKLNKGKRYQGQPIMKPFGCFSCIIFWVVGLYAFIAMDLSIIISIGVAVASSILGLLIDKLMMIIIRVINKIE